MISYKEEKMVTMVWSGYVDELKGEDFVISLPFKIPCMGVTECLFLNEEKLYEWNVNNLIMSKRKR